jgi:hypothetical protein
MISIDEGDPSGRSFTTIQPPTNLRAGPSTPRIILALHENLGIYLDESPHFVARM